MTVKSFCKFLTFVDQPSVKFMLPKILENLLPLTMLALSTFQKKFPTRKKDHQIFYPQHIHQLIFTPNEIQFHEKNSETWFSKAFSSVIRNLICCEKIQCCQLDLVLNFLGKDIGLQFLNNKLATLKLVKKVSRICQ